MISGFDHQAAHVAASDLPPAAVSTKLRVDPLDGGGAVVQSVAPAGLAPVEP